MSRHSEPADLTLTGQQVTNYVPSDELAEILRAEGLDALAVKTPTVNAFSKIAWEDLCVIPTKDRKTMVSDVFVVMRVTLDPDAEQEYKDYRGLMQAFGVLESSLDRVFVSHAMQYADSGEYLPLTEWMRNQVVPFRCRIGRSETRKVNQFVVRVVPIDIPLG